MKHVFTTLLLALTSTLGNVVNWTLVEKATVSVGVYNAQGRLIKTVLAAKELPAGSYSVTWDGLDNIGEPAPVGNYTWKVVRNGNTYSSGTALGNTAFPTTTAGHVPSYMEGLSVDAAGDVYTVNGWDEAHSDVIKRSGATGNSMLVTGHPVGDVLEGIAVEPDGAFAYVVSVTGNRLDTANQVKSEIYKFDLASRHRTMDGYGRDTLKVDFTDLGGPFKVYDRDANYPAGATVADKSTMSIPIRSLALRGDTIYAPDSLGNRILKVHKVSGASGTINNVPVACGIAIDGSGNIWVGNNHSKISVYSPAGSLLGTPITGLGEVRSLAISGSTLYVADYAVNQVKKYSISGLSATLQGTFGRPMEPGDRANNALKELRAVATDSQRNLFIADRPGDGGRLQKLAPDMTLVWQQLCLEFSSVASFSKDNPDTLWTSRQRAYHINHATGAWEYLGWGRTDIDGNYFGNFLGTDEGPPRVVSLNGQDFFFMPTRDNGIGMYRVFPPVNSTRGPTLKLASCIAAAWPLPDGGIPADGAGDDVTQYLWSWNDDLSPTPTPTTVNRYYTPAQRPYQFVIAATHVDDQGRLILGVDNHWFPGTQFDQQEQGSIWIMTPTFNSKGTPVYRWDTAVKLFSNADARRALSLLPNEQIRWGLVAYDNGMFYSLGPCSKSGLPQNPALHAGGNTLMGFKEQTPGTLQTFTEPQWKIFLPRSSAGLAPVRGGAGGVLIGGEPRLAEINHYDKDGLLLKIFAPGVNLTGSYNTDGGHDWVSGGFDSLQCLQAERAPDGLVDVFAQDNLNQRIIWYRIDDRHVQVVGSGQLTIGAENAGTHYELIVNSGIGSGKYLAGSVVNIRADDPPAGKVFAGWTGGFTNNNGTISIVMPPEPATATANYEWRQGNDKIRFLPGQNSESNLDGSVWEGANSINGPWTSCYDTPFNQITPDGTLIPAVHPGWNEAEVDFGGARYLRWRKRLPYNEGVIMELEFYRDGQKLSGTPFGSNSVNPELTFVKATDGDPNTRFNWADTGPLGAHAGIDTGDSPIPTPTPNPTPTPPLPTPTPSIVTFVGIDTATQGNWKDPNAYGIDGHYIPGSTTLWPAWVTVVISGGGITVWEASTTDIRALMKAESVVDRIASARKAKRITVDVNVLLLANERVAFYFCDWNRDGRAADITVSNADTGVLLDSRQVSNFGDGQYFKWQVKGHVKFTIARISGHGAVVNGIFFDPR